MGQFNELRFKLELGVEEMERIREEDVLETVSKSGGLNKLKEVNSTCPDLASTLRSQSQFTKKEYDDSEDEDDEIVERFMKEKEKQALIEEIMKENPKAFKKTQAGKSNRGGSSGGLLLQSQEETDVSRNKTIDGGIESSSE